MRSESRPWTKTISHSWVCISHGSNNLVTNLNNNEQETSEVQFEEYALKLNASDFACRSKAKAEPQRRELAGSSTRTTPIGERIWTDVEPGEYSISDYAVSKKLIHLLRHGRLFREDDGAIEFWRIKDDLQKYFLHCHHWSDDKWKKSMAGGGGNKKRYQYCTDSTGVSWTSELSKVIQDSVSLILLYKTTSLFRATSFKTFIMSDVQSILHSIVNSELIPRS